MITSVKKLNNVHFEHLIWHNELQNYLEEIQIIDDRIKMLMQEDSPEELNELREIRNQFHELRDQIRTSKVAIGEHEYRIMEVAALDGAIELITDSQHDDIRKKIKRLRKSMLRLKDRFHFFLAKGI